MLLIAGAYESLFKDSLRHTGIDDRSWHVLAGLIVYFAAATLLRRPLSSIVPLLAVGAAETANEWLDRQAFGDWRWPDTLDDILLTFAGPLPLYLAMAWLAPRPAARKGHLSLEPARRASHRSERGHGRGAAGPDGLGDPGAGTMAKTHRGAAEMKRGPS